MPHRAGHHSPRRTWPATGRAAVRSTHRHRRAPAVGVEHGQCLGLEVNPPAGVQEPRQQAADQLLLRVDGVPLAAAEAAVIQAEPAVLGAELAHTVLPAVAMQILAQPVPVQDPHRVRSEETGPRPGPQVFTARTFHDDAVDPAAVEEAAEDQAGRPCAEDDHVG